MSYPFWKDEVTCYELHTTMRQKYIQFITILDKMRINKQSDKDIEYMNSHCCKRSPLDPLFPYIFYTNKDVKKHNEQMLIQVNGELICLEGIDHQ